MEPITTTKAPQAIGPYSQAMKAGNMIFCSGQIPMDPTTMEIVGKSIEEQTKQVFKNIRAVLAAENLTLHNIIKTSVFLDNMNDFSSMNKIYEQEFDGHKPARSCVEVSQNPRGVLVEIECIAIKE